MKQFKIGQKYNEVIKYEEDKTNFYEIVSFTKTGKYLRTELNIKLKYDNAVLKLKDTFRIKKTKDGDEYINILYGIFPSVIYAY